MNIVSLFSGTGGLDRGFEEAGFKISWANEFDKTIWETYEKNFPKTHLDKRSILDIPFSDIPDCDGIIGGPPCQSWSAAGSQRGIKDPRGQLFYNYVDIIREKKPKFFLAENVAGLVFKKHKKSLYDIFNNLLELGYNVSYQLLNAKDYSVPQDRKRFFIVGYTSSLNDYFLTPKKNNRLLTLRDVIYDLKDNAVPAIGKNKSNPKAILDNHEYMKGDFSSIYMSRNRVRSWDEPSFTIQASGRHAPCHPNAPKMEPVKKDVMKFPKGSKKLYRRLSVRECARIQTFPDKHILYYNSINDGYKMMGNAVPVALAKKIALGIKKDFKKFHNIKINYKEKGKLLNLEDKNLNLF